jgi:hypothetical protein
MRVTGAVRNRSVSDKFGDLHSPQIIVALQLFTTPMPIRDKNLTILTDAEKRALYDLPDFDEFQRAEYFSLTAQELASAFRRDGVSAQILCLLQIGYFKAKQAFFTTRPARLLPQ